MRKNLIVFVLTCLAAGLYYFLIPYSDLAIAKNDMEYKAPSESTLLQFQTLSTQKVEMKAFCNGYSYCILPLSFIEKMAGFGVTVQDFLLEAGDNLQGPLQEGQTVQLTTTTSMSILNYVHTPSKPFTAGKTYVLILGKFGENHTLESTETIEIKL